MFATWWAWLLLYVVIFPVWVVVWAAGGLLGLGWFGEVAAELVFHLMLACILHSFLPKLLRNLVREELLLLAARE